MKTVVPFPTLKISLLSLLASFLLLAGCGDFSLYSQLDGENANRIREDNTGILKIIPESVFLPATSSFTFAASGGFEPYSFSVSEGGGSIIENTGVYTASDVSGSAAVRVTDDSGAAAEAEITVTVIEAGQFSISPSAISLYINNSVTFNSIGGESPYTYSLESGSGTVDSGTGVYTAPGSPGTDVVRSTDDDGNTSDAEITILRPLKLEPASIYITVNHTYTFTGDGGSPPYTYGMQSGNGSIDPGTGEYTAPASAGTEAVQVEDSAGNTASASITVTEPAALVIHPAETTVNVNDTVFFSATGGTAPYSFSIYSGGGSVDSGTGEYTAPGTAGSAVIRVTDNAGAVSDGTVTAVASGPLSITPASAVVEQNKIQHFSGSGGTPPYTFSVTSGPGSIGVFTGVYTASSGIDSATVRLTDSLNNFTEAGVDIAPAAPTDLFADGAFDSDPQTIRLSWTDNASGEDGYKIERKHSGGDFTSLPTTAPLPTTVPADSESYTDSTCSPNTVYTYRVYAYTGGTNSGYSGESADIPNPNN